MSWSYYRDAYYQKREAIEQYRPALLKNPAIAQALTLIDIAEAAIEQIIHREEGDDND